ncbi:MAG: glutamate--tRNA ligase [Rickettsiaceae bacterium]
MTVITRFAPSPTGFLHIGSARTALFNYLFAKKNKGKFCLRIEDTDKERSTEKATIAILESMKWLGLDYDGEIIYQSTREARHQEVALSLVKNNRAYFCFLSQEEIALLREKALVKKEHFIFNSPWRDVDIADYPQGIKPVIRLKAPKEGVTIVRDLLQGDVVVQNAQLDDMILLRSNGTPTYMLAVVVDDHDMGITHIIRGDDHLSNAHRQQILYDALGYNIPAMVHIPLIHGADGAKLSKRHGALGTESYKEMGYLPEALCNYLLRLGWAHGDDEIIQRDKAIEWFNIEGLGKSPARLDFNKMKFLNAHYLKQKNDAELADMVINMIEEDRKISTVSKDNILKAMPSLKTRAELLVELKQIAMMYVIDFPLDITDEARKIIDETDDNLLETVNVALISLKEFDKKLIQEKLKEIAGNRDMKLGELMHFIRAFIAGDVKSPSVFEMIEILGLETSLHRLKKLI